MSLSLRQCDASVLSQSGFEMQIQTCTSLIRDNWAAIAVFIVIIIFCVIMCIAVIQLIWNSISAWYKQRSSSGPTAKVKTVTGALTVQDDYIYDDRSLREGQTGVDPELPGLTEASALLGTLSQLEGRYSAYNRAISNYLGSKGQTVDDVYDAKIMSRDHDDYEYPSVRNPNAKDQYLAKQVRTTEDA